MADSASPRIDLLVQGWTLNTNEGRLGFCGVTLIEVGGRRILVDVAQVGRRLLILDRLAARGLSPRDIDTVVMTHTHWDHLLNADVFTQSSWSTKMSEPTPASRIRTTGPPRSTPTQSSSGCACARCARATRSRRA